MIGQVCTILLLVPAFISLTDGCGRVPATPPPTTPLIPTEPTINGSVRSVRCTEAEVNETACLNGGTCFAMWLSDDERVSSCHCPKNYARARCQEFVFILPTTDDPVARAGIAASIAVLIIITVVFVAVAILYYRRKRREREAVERNKDASQEPLQSNGLNGLPENHVPPRNSMIYKPNGNSNYIHLDEKRLMLETYEIKDIYKVTSV